MQVYKTLNIKIYTDGSNILHTYSVERDFRTPILGDKVPEKFMDDNVLQKR